MNTIEFSRDSNLQIIDKNVFSHTSIKNITILSSVTIIKESALSNCPLDQIEFTEDSNLETIENNVFRNSNIESITIPSKLIDLKDNWCKITDKLTKVKVSPDNKRYRCIDDQIIIGKSSIELDEYDELLFCSRAVKTVTIPDSIKRICPSAFEDCQQPTDGSILSKYMFHKKPITINISNYSKLQILDEWAFFGASIESITLPSTVTHIK